MMERTAYSDYILQKRLSIQVGSEIENILRDALNKTFDEVEQRFRVYAERYQPFIANCQPTQFKRNISRIERNIQRYFHDHEERIFARDRKVIQRGYPHRAALKKCFVSLTRNINVHSSHMWDALLEKHVMSESDQDSIIGRPNRISQNEEFFTFLYGKLTQDDFHDIFLPALKIDHLHIFDELVVAMEEVEEEVERDICVACRVRTDVQVKRLATSLLRRGHITIPQHGDLRGNRLSNNNKWSILRHVSDNAIIESLASKYPDYHKMLERMGTLTCSCAENSSKEDLTGNEVAASSGSLESERDATDRYDSICDMEEFVNPSENTGVYKMKHNDRGLCLIINNYKFSRDKLKERVGSKIDRDNLTSTFTALGFLCIVEENVTFDRLTFLMNKYSTIDHSSFDAFVCCILTYGSKSNIYCSDGIAVPIPEITSHFTASRCPHLAGKPKLFFIQSDRGSDKMQGCTLPVLDAHYVIQQESDDGYTLPSHAVTEAILPEVIADEADFLVGYSTVEGYVSYRSVTKGSWYISKLCEVLNRDADRNGLLSCLLRVNGEVARGGDVLRHLKQVPAPVFTLTKEVHLTIVPSQT